MSNREEVLLQRESFLMQELQTVEKMRKSKEEVRKAKRSLGIELQFFTDRELDQRIQQLQQELNVVRFQYERERKLQLQQELNEPYAQSDSSAVETAVRVGASGLMGYALGKAIHSVK